MGSGSRESTLSTEILPQTAVHAVTSLRYDSQVNKMSGVQLASENIRNENMAEVEAQQKEEMNTAQSGISSGSNHDFTKNYSKQKEAKSEEPSHKRTCRPPT